MLLALALGLGWESRARADDPPPAPASVTELTPPKLIFGGEPVYPASASGNANVVVEAVVGADGSVESARAVEGAPPFDVAAAEAVRGYRFEPAQRQGKPVRARVRLIVAFTEKKVSEPEPVPAPPPEGPAPPAPPASPPPPGTPEEVHVTGRRYETRSPTEHRMTRAEVRLMAGAFGDPFRAIEILPGVVPTISGLPYYYVRGAPPSAVGYFVDEVRVPYLFHFGLGPGVIHPALVNEVALHPAAFPGRFGRYSGGIVAGETKEPSAKLTGEGLIRLYDAGAFVEAPLAGGKAHVAVGGRYSYTGLLLTLLLPETTIQYQDYNARASVELGDRTRLSLFAFGAFDYASNKKDGKENVLFASEFHRVDLRLDHDGENRSHSRLALTVGLDRTRIEADRFARDWVVGIRGRHRMVLGKSMEAELGADLTADLYGGDLPSMYAVGRDEYEQAASLYSPRTETASGAWLTALIKPVPGMEMTATARADVFTSAGKVAVGPSPRLSARVPLRDKVTALFALGVAPQPPAFAIPLPAVGYSGLPGGLSYAYQKSAGVEVLLPLGFRGTAVGFHHSYFNLRDVFADRGDADINTPQTKGNAPGQAFGLELLLTRKMANRVSATVSYTLSRSQLGSTATRSSAINLFDRTHVFQAAGAVDMSHGWFGSIRTVIYTGWPKQDDLLARRDGRLPLFFRFDARLEKRWNWRKSGYISLIFEGLNVTASKEVLSQKCSPDGCKNEEFGPLIVPSIGVEGAL
jgi:TonB family protein